MQIHVAQCDLTELPVDAIVNPANSTCVMSHGIAAAILLRGGKEIEQEARMSAPIAVGAAVITSGGTLPSRLVIHAPISEEPTAKATIESVRRATRAALVAAAVKGLETIALPPMADAITLPIDESARAMVDELRAHRHATPATVYLIAADDEATEAFEEALQSAAHPSSS